MNSLHEHVVNGCSNWISYLWFRNTAWGAYMQSIRPWRSPPVWNLKLNASIVEDMNSTCIDTRQFFENQKKIELKITIMPAYEFDGFNHLENIVWLSISSRMFCSELSIQHAIATYLPGTASSKTWSGLISVPSCKWIEQPPFNLANIGPNL
jgi:hypothetical protein